MEQWNGYNCEKFKFEDRDAIIVFPSVEPNGKLAIKTVYWGAFPDIEMRLLDKGFHLTYIQNFSRFATPADCDLRARFVKFIAQKYNLNPKCVPIGMSCGGAHAVNFAGYYPELVSCMFIDAPVLNFNDFPAKYSRADFHNIWDHEFKAAYPGIERYKLMNFPHHPLCRTETLIENRIPILMVYGVEDATVTFSENGQLLQEAMANTGLLTTIKVVGRGHHPHGKIDDNTEIVNWIIEHC